jgi:hypothetical protein
MLKKGMGRGGYALTLAVKRGRGERGGVIQRRFAERRKEGMEGRALR